MDKSYVLDVSQRPVHHGISESVRHIEGITTARCQLMVSYRRATQEHTSESQRQ
jgi:hypothetical protein